MAGPFTHFMVCYQAKNDGTINQELCQLLNRHAQFLYLGAASPDLPYLSFKKFGHKNWADLMHYEKTNAVAVYGFDRLKSRWSVKTEAEEVTLAWLMGYVSHLVADAAMHPIIYLISGKPYEEHKKEHRECEMTQDVFIYNEVTGTEIFKAEFSTRIKNCEQSPYFDGLMEFWKSLLIEGYSNEADKPDPRLWFETYSKAVDLAEGGEGAALFRHVCLVEDLFYKRLEEVPSEDASRFYTEAKLPTDKIGAFRVEGFDRTVRYLLQDWNLLYGGLTGFGLEVSNIIRPWNLDTGGDMEGSGVLTFWPEVNSA